MEATAITSVKGKSIIRSAFFGRCAEDAQGNETFARGLWNDFGPTNLLEAFLVQDVIQTEWRLIRMRNLYHLVQEQGSRSTTDHDCGLPFGFLQDSQGLGVSEILQQYEKVLHRRLEKRVGVLCKDREWGSSYGPCIFNAFRERTCDLGAKTHRDAPSLLGSLPADGHHKMFAG